MPQTSRSATTCLIPTRIASTATRTGSAAKREAPEHRCSAYRCSFAAVAGKAYAIGRTTSQAFHSRLPAAVLLPRRPPPILTWQPEHE